MSIITIFSHKYFKKRKKKHQNDNLFQRSLIFHIWNYIANFGQNGVVTYDQKMLLIKYLKDYIICYLL